MVSREVEEKQLWMHQYTVQNNKTSQNPGVMLNDSQCNSPADSVSSLSHYDYRNRDAECLKVTEVRTIVASGENDFNE